MRKAIVNHRRPHPHGGKTNFTATLFGVSAAELAERAIARGYEVHARADGVSWRIRPGVCYSAYEEVSSGFVSLGVEQRMTFYRCMDTWQMDADLKAARSA